MYRSSLDAVLAHATELELTEAQLQRLNQLEDEREARDTASRTAAAPPPADKANEGPPEGPASGSGGRRHGGGGMGRGGRGAGGHGSREGHGRGSSQHLVDELDAHDNDAFTAGLEVLTDVQRARAIELATKFRAELFDYRQGAGPD